MESPSLFLAHAVRLEAAAAQRSDELADAMATWGNREVEAFFRKMAQFSRLHLKDAMDRAGFRAFSDVPKDGFTWPDGVPPESTDWWAVDGLLDMGTAIEMALAGEKRGFDYYDGVARSTSNPTVRDMAAEFAEEEADHVAQLEQVLADYRAKHPG